MALSRDQKSALRVAQLDECLGDPESIKKILEKEGDINYAIPFCNPYGLTKPLKSKYTALHFAYSRRKLDLFNKLLNIGADFSKKNGEDQTVLHMMVQDLTIIDRPLDERYIYAVLSAHVNTNNFSNSYDKRGFSHFHIACMCNNATAVQFFLDNGVSVDDPVHLNTTLLPGYTPLHLAAMFTNIEVVELLLAHGANMHAIDTSGKTALHVLIMCRIGMFSTTSKTQRVENVSYEQLQEQIKRNETIINMLMENMSSDNDCLDHIGMSNFHVACMLQDTSAAQHLIDRVTDVDHSLNRDSQLWPGCTALHFAAHGSLKNVEMLIKKGANFGKQDAAGITLDICIERYEIEDVCHILSLNADWVNITFSDGKTNLISFLLTLTNRNQFKRLIDRSIDDVNIFIPMESPLWPVKWISRS